MTSTSSRPRRSMAFRNGKSFRVQSTCVEIKFGRLTPSTRCCHCDFHTALDEAFAHQLLLLLALGARQFIQSALFQLLGDLPRRWRCASASGHGDSFLSGGLGLGIGFVLGLLALLFGCTWAARPCAAARRSSSWTNSPSSSRLKNWKSCMEALALLLSRFFPLLLPSLSVSLKYSSTCCACARASAG